MRLRLATRKYASLDGEYDIVHEQVKFWRQRTNIEERKRAYDQVLREFEWQEIVLGGYNRCVLCNTSLDRDITQWAFKRGVRWFCGHHYNNFYATMANMDDQERATALEHIYKDNLRSFKLMIRKRDREV